MLKRILITDDKQDDQLKVIIDNVKRTISYASDY